MKQIGLLSLLATIFAIAGVAMADSYTYVGGDQYGGAGVYGIGQAEVGGSMDMNGNSWSCGGGTDIYASSGFSGGVDAFFGAGSVDAGTYASVSAQEGHGYSMVSASSGTSTYVQTMGNASAGMSAGAYAGGMAWN
jgi:hypothetical protein